MKLGGLDLPDLPALALPRLPLAAFRRRIVFHGVFALLALATVALAVSLLAEEKQRNRQRYEAGFQQTLAALVAQLRHPTGQLALLNAARSGGAASGNAPAAGLTPWVLPFSALDFDDPFKARQAVEMSGCALQWPGGDQLCTAVGASAYAGGFVYLVASLTLPPATPRERGTLDLNGVHRARVSLRLRGSEALWTAPFEAAGDAPVRSPSGALRGRLTGFAGGEDLLDPRARPDRDFRGWLWQDAECASPASVAPPTAAADCLRHSLLSLRLPVSAWREALFQHPGPSWPPPDLGQTLLRLQWLAPDGSVAFDSATPGATAPFTLADLATRLAPGETLRIQRQAPPGAATSVAALAELHGREADPEPASPWLTRLILRLPYDGMANRADPTIQAAATVPVFGQPYRLELRGDLRSVDRGLGATATRLSGYVGAMLAAIGVAWLLIAWGLMHRVAVLTKRAAALSYNMQDPQVDRRLGDLDVADLRGRDELGILAGTLASLLQRVKDGVRREHIRVEQELDMWHAVGHEIMSPLQSLMVLHGQPSDPSHRYVQRMQQAVRVLYGSASPSEAIESAALRLDTLDLAAFMEHVADNAPFAGIADVQLAAARGPMPVLADEHSLEDVVTHVLRNADRHRTPATPITLGLRAEAGLAVCEIHNLGPAIADEMLERIFEYGVSDAPAEQARAQAAETGPRRGQGLFVARTYMAKMGGTISARNDADGPTFVLRLPRVA